MSHGSRNIRRFVDPTLFAESTDEGLFEATSNRYRDSVLSLLNDYLSLSPPGTTAIDDKKLTKALSYVNAMVDFAEDYLRQPSTASEEEARWGFSKFLAKAREQQAELKQRHASTGGKESSVPVDARAKTLREHMPGDPGKLFDKVGLAVDKSVPKNGDKASFTVELSFPTPSGVKAKANMLVAAERNDGRLKANARIMLGAGVGVKALGEVAVTVGGYLEAEAGDPRSLGALLERALYDRVQATPGVPSEVLGYLFGTGGDSGGALVAQERMAAIDQQRFKQKGNYTESGGAVEGKAGNENVATAAGGATFGTRRDAPGGAAKAARGLNVAVNVQKPVVLDFQLQLKQVNPGTKQSKIIGAELSAEALLDHEKLLMLHRKGAHHLAAFVHAALQKAAILSTELFNADGNNGGLTAARLASSLAVTQGVLITRLMGYQKSSPLPGTQSDLPKKGLEAKGAVGLGIKLDLANSKVSVTLKHLSEVALNLGELGAVKATRSSEMGGDLYDGSQQKR